MANEPSGDNVAFPGDYSDKYGSKLNGLNNAGKALKADVDYGDAPLTLNSMPQPEINLMAQGGDNVLHISLDNASKFGYTVVKKSIIG
jgi:hypothetical protein